MLFYRAALPLSRKTLTFVSGIICRHRAPIGSPWRALNPGRQALLVLVHLRKREPFAQVAAGFGVGTATAWKYVTETVALLAARAPELRQAVRAAVKAGYPFAVLDGTLIRTDRVAADRPFFSGKHHCHGMNLQVIASPAGQQLLLCAPLRVVMACLNRDYQQEGGKRWQQRQPARVLDQQRAARRACDQGHQAHRGRHLDPSGAAG